MVFLMLMLMLMLMLLLMLMLMGKVEKYMKLHRELLGSYDPLHLPVRPSQEALERMKGVNLNI